MISHNGKEYFKNYIYIYTQIYKTESVCLANFTAEINTTLYVNCTSNKNSFKMNASCVDIDL